MDALSSFINWDHLHGEFRKSWETNLGRTEPWAMSMGISADACRHLQLGYRTDKRSITWPERDHEGNIVGIGCRDIKSGKKYMVEGSRHGLIYAPDPEWGGVFTPEHPILIVEGATDVAACLTRDTYAIGNPSALGTVESNAYLEKVVQGRRIALICENDGGVGTVAFLASARRLVRYALSIWTVEPPSSVKDIREWFKVDDGAMDRIADQIEGRKPWSDDPGMISVSPDILEDIAPLRIADQMIFEHYTVHGKLSIHSWNGLWFRFTDNHYIQLDDDYVRADVYRWLDHKKVLKKKGKGPDADWLEEPYTPTAQKVNGVIDALRSRPDVLIPPKASMPMWIGGQDGHPRPEDMICFNNGILDLDKYLKSGHMNFASASPLWFSQSHCPYDFDPAQIGSARPFLDYLDDVFNKDESSIRLLQEWLFYCMTPDTSHEKFMLMVGRPAAGKGTVMDVLKQVIGGVNIYDTRLDSLGSRFGLYGALGKNNIFLSDAHISQVEKASTALEVVKTITGRGAIDVEGKGSNATSMLLPAKFTISVNELPNFHDAAAAMRRRLLCLWFPNSYEGKQDTRLKARLCDPAIIRGLAVWAMIGGRRLRKQCGFTLPAISKSVAIEFERTNTPVSAFVMEECLIEEEAQISKITLYASWSFWCRHHGIKPGGNAAFGRNLMTCLPHVKSSRGPRDYTRDEKRKPQYVGIRLRTRFDADRKL